MYGQYPLRDAVWAARAVATNQVARLAPRLYLQITKQTGRGQSASETTEHMVAYFRKCFREYFEILGEAPETYLRGKTLLEYGPGDCPGVALLMLAYGAKKVFCVDRFPMLTESQKNRAAIEMVLRELPPEHQLRARGAYRDATRIEYLVRPSGLSGLREEVDFVYSRSVLEHVDDVPATFADMAVAMKPGALAIHKVDLKSHGLHRENQLDFLSWPKPLWDLMFSEKGFPNRWRVDHYRRAIRSAGLRAVLLEATAYAQAVEVAQVRPYLAAPFRQLPDEDLAWLGFWLVCTKASAVESASAV